MLPVTIQPPIPDPCWFLCGYLVPNTFLILWFYSNWWWPPAYPLRLSTGSLFLSSPFLFLNPRFKGSSLHLNIVLCPSLYIDHVVLLLSVYWEMIIKIFNNWYSTGNSHQKTSDPLCISAEWPHVSLVGADLYPQGSKLFKIRAVFYLPMYHQCPAHGRCLINTCRLHKSKVTWKRQGDEELVKRTRALLQVTWACCYCV